ncbi:OLC1v1021858C1 [Oldenlandia corymbosa var. corymbosa]|uniref:OLC1v1021858C1 n=1 Tax=Oldenlandia corymbosa var. corymbosa TaxID=529605 RepID=A0AAV1BX70_OLDCO|nr:OLC1v1021858C1 [Oldenlandia corymbosa var. corymbosa]
MKNLLSSCWGVAGGAESMAAKRDDDNDGCRKEQSVARWQPALLPISENETLKAAKKLARSHRVQCKPMKTCTKLTKSQASSRGKNQGLQILGAGILLFPPAMIII